MTKQKFICTTVKLAVRTKPNGKLIKLSSKPAPESRIIGWHYLPEKETLDIGLLLQGTA
jgi:hypothetical protein